MRKIVDNFLLCAHELSEADDERVHVANNHEEQRAAHGSRVEREAQRERDSQKERREDDRQNALPRLRRAHEALHGKMLAHVTNGR